MYYQLKNNQFTVVAELFFKGVLNKLFDKKRLFENEANTTGQL